MDRELSPEYVKSIRKRRIITAVSICIAVFAVLYFFRASLGSSVKRSKITTATAEFGDVENTISATGEIMPAYEQIFTSPIRASVKRILIAPGATVNPGQAILELDKSISEIELARFQDQLALKRNGIDQLRMQLDKKLYDAEINDKIKSLNIKKLTADFEDAVRLQKVGGGTLEDVTRAQNLLKIAQLEKSLLENDLKYNRQSMGASLKETELGARIEEKNLLELQHKLKVADVIADRKGVLTWVNENIGSSVNEGEMLAKVADLGSFRVEGSSSDVYADEIKPGLQVIVKINETTLRGIISLVKPAVKNGVVQFLIQLDNARNESLRPNMKADVYIVTNRSRNVMRVANGPVFKGKKRQYVFVLNGDSAIRKEVEVGLSNFEFVEIKSGLEKGDKVILSDMSSYEHLQNVAISD